MEQPFDATDQPSRPAASGSGVDRAGRIESALLLSVERDKELVAIIGALVRVTEELLVAIQAHRDKTVHLIAHCETMTVGLQAATQALREMTDAFSAGHFACDLQARSKQSAAGTVITNKLLA